MIIILLGLCLLGFPFAILEFKSADTYSRWFREIPPKKSDGLTDKNQNG